MQNLLITLNYTIRKQCNKKRLTSMQTIYIFILRCCARFIIWDLPIFNIHILEKYALACQLLLLSHMWLYLILPYIQVTGHLFTYAFNLCVVAQTFAGGLLNNNSTVLSYFFLTWMKSRTRTTRTRNDGNKMRWLHQQRAAAAQSNEHSQTGFHAHTHKQFACIQFYKCYDAG